MRVQSPLIVSAVLLLTACAPATQTKVASPAEVSTGSTGGPAQWAPTSAPAVPPQARPVVALLRALATGERKAMEQEVFSRRMVARWQRKKGDWDLVLAWYRAMPATVLALSGKRQKYCKTWYAKMPRARLTYAFEGGAQKGRVIVLHPGGMNITADCKVVAGDPRHPREWMSLRVVQEGGRWWVDEK